MVTLGTKPPRARCIIQMVTATAVRTFSGRRAAVQALSPARPSSQSPISRIMVQDQDGRRPCRLRRRAELGHLAHHLWTCFWITVAALTRDP